MIIEFDQNFFLIIKILLTAYVIILVPIYWKNYGAENFLWASDIGLFLTLLGLWFESSLLISIVSISVLPVEIAWNLDFFIELLTGNNLLGLADYMFESKYSLLLKSLSLFHIFMPIIWIFCLIKWGYDSNAIIYSIILCWIILILTYFFSDPENNINWVFIPEKKNWSKMPSLLWLIILMIGFPTLIFWPMHEFLKIIFINS